MKPNKWIVISFLTAWTAMAAGAAIDWLWHGDPIVEAVHHPSGDKVQFGLREDGVVVWRKIIQTTNSPAERPPAWDGWIVTNMPATRIWSDSTNIIITNLYLEAPWTNLAQPFKAP